MLANLHSDLAGVIRPTCTHMGEVLYKTFCLLGIHNFNHSCYALLQNAQAHVRSIAMQLVQDLRTLRALAEYLLRFDAVTFLMYLENLRATEGVTSVWLFHDAAHTIFEQVCILGSMLKARAYK